LLAETLAEAARRFGDRPALVADEGLVLTYAQLDAMADEVAVALGRRGLVERDVLALVLPSIPEHFVAYLAAAKLGVVTAAVNPKLTPTERAKVLEKAGPTLVLTTAALAHQGSLVPSVIIEPATNPESVLVGLRVLGAKPAPLARDPDRPVAIVFTSGTTGLPKGAVFCDRQIEFITSCDVGAEWGGGGNTLAGSALAHLGPTTKLEGNLKRGVSQHLAREWKSVDALRRVAELKIAGLGGVPTQIALMLRDPDFDDLDLSSIQAIVMGGGPATPSLIREARARFGVPLSVRYSCTEAGIGTGTGFTDPLEDAEISVGRPQPGVTLEIVSAEGAPVPAGEVGEVCLGSPAAMSGYWRDPEATALAFTATGLVRTGDLGWLDDQARLRLSGRSRERYVRGGYNVYPIEVESVLADHPSIRSVAVIAVPDAVMGEIGVAVVVPFETKPAPTLAEIRNFAGEQLARYKLPDQMLVRDELPLTAMDKVDRVRLERELRPQT
jgi:acyl-CoA synthetase (AMP-forming)/AMP-acid ligase II